MTITVQAVDDTVIWKMEVSAGSTIAAADASVCIYFMALRQFKEISPQVRPVIADIPKSIFMLTKKAKPPKGGDAKPRV